MLMCNAYSITPFAKGVNSFCKQGLDIKYMGFCLLSKTTSLFSLFGQFDTFLWQVRKFIIENLQGGGWKSWLFILICQTGCKCVIFDRGINQYLMVTNLAQCCNYSNLLYLNLLIRFMNQCKIIQIIAAGHANLLVFS